MVDCIDDFAACLNASRSVKVEPTIGWNVVVNAGKGLHSLASRVLKVPELPDLGLTQREKIVTGVVLGYGIYRVHRDVGFCNLFKSLKLSNLKLRLGIKPKVVMREKTSSDVSREFETKRPGSDEIELAAPRSQCQLGELVDGKFEVFGCAVVMGHVVKVGSESVEYWFLVMPEHAWNQSKRIWAKGKQSQVDLTYKRDTRDVVDLATDLIAVRITAKEMSTIGVSSQGITHYLPEYGGEVKIVGCMGLGTVGMLKHDASIFGRVAYQATTLKGYSGAAYILNGQIAGVHTYGSKVINGGYSASYIWSLLSHHIRLDARSDEGHETTPDYLLNTIKQGKKIRLDKSYFDDEYVRIQIDGKYSVVKAENLRNVCGRDFWDGADDRGYVKIVEHRNYVDREEFETIPSGEAKSLADLGGSSISGNPKEQLQLAIQNTIQELLTTLPHKKLKEARSSVLQKKPEQVSIATQESSKAAQPASSSH